MSEALTIFVEPVEQAETSDRQRRREAILDAKLAREIYRKRPPVRPAQLDLRA